MGGFSTLGGGGGVDVGALEDSYIELFKARDTRAIRVLPFAEVLYLGNVAEMGYEAEWFDCDNFSFRAMGVWHGDKELARMACFIVWVWWRDDNKTYAHALNCAYDGQLKLIEPQNYRVFSVPSNWNLILLLG